MEEAKQAEEAKLAEEAKQQVSHPEQDDSESEEEEDSQEEEDSEQESSEEDSSSSCESCTSNGIDLPLDNPVLDPTKMCFTRHMWSPCVHKLPRVGQLVDLNKYECYFAVRKVPKPSIFPDNCEGVVRSVKQDLQREIQEHMDTSGGYTSRDSTRKILEDDGTNHSSGSENSNEAKPSSKMIVSKVK